MILIAHGLIKVRADSGRFSKRLRAKSGLVKTNMADRGIGGFVPRFSATPLPSALSLLRALRTAPPPATLLGCSPALRLIVV